MAVITKQELEDAAVDAQTLEDVANGDSNTTVTSRLGTSVKSVAKAIGEISAYDDKGAWATTTSYVLKDLVQESGIIYICTVAHTSGTFATDLAAGKWGIFQTQTPELFLSSYASLSAAVTAIGATEAQLILDKDDSMTGNISIPETLTLRPVKGNIITVNSGNTLTLNGKLVAGRFKVFNLNSGTIDGSGNPALYPEWFGAKGDGTTDDVQAFIDTLLTISNMGGGSCILDSVTYRITSSVRGYSNTTITGTRSSIVHFDTLDFGQTPGRTGDADDLQEAGFVFNSGLISTKTGDRAYSYTNYAPWANGAPLENIWIKGISIKSNANYGDTFSSTHKGVRLHGCRRSGVKDCYVTGFKGEALSMQELGEYNEFTGNNIYNCAQNAFDLNGRINHTRVTNNTAQKVGQLVELIGWDNVCSENIVDTYSINGIMISQDSAGYEVSANICNNRVINFDADPTLNNPIRIQQGAGIQRDIIVANNFIRGTFLNAIAAYNEPSSGGAVIIRGNIIREEGSTVNIGSGIQVQGSCDRILIEGNFLVFSTGYPYAAITASAGNSECLICNNIIKAATAFRGAGVIFSDCIQLESSPTVGDQRLWNNLFNGAKISEPNGAFASGDTTPSIKGKNLWSTSNASPTTVTNFDDGYFGQEITILIGDSNTTIDFTSGTLKGNGGVAWAAPSNSVLRAVYDGSKWRCTIGEGA